MDGQHLPSLSHCGFWYPKRGVSRVKILVLSDAEMKVKGVGQVGSCWFHKKIKGMALKGFYRYPNTLPETNMAPENQWLEDECPFGMAHLQVLC